jgi:hypothetical protein
MSLAKVGQSACTSSDDPGASVDALMATFKTG